VADTTLTAITFPGDVRAHIYVSWLHPFKEQRFVVVGEKRMVVFDDTAPWPEKLVSYEHMVDWEEGRVPVARKVGGEAIAVEEAEPLRLQSQAFLRSIATREAPLVGAASGVAVLRVLNAAQRSLEAGGVPLDPQRHDDAYIHATATVDAGASIGSGTKIWHQTHVMPDATIGARCTLGQNVFVGRGVRIGEGCKIQNNVSVFEGVTLESRVFCGPSVVFTNVRDPRAEVGRDGNYDETLVHEGATLGANATIICGNTIGRYAFVGAGAVVTRDVPDHAVVAGNPARHIGWRCRCGHELPSDTRPTCNACGRTYEAYGDGLRER
jgi:UDP-2-acetamido-3-amino-2,3-dideoxy-glucuronate N-acetyltransferase